MLTATNTRHWPFRFVSMGNSYVQFKQRYKSDIGGKIWADPALNPYRRDLLCYTTRTGKIVICGITSRDITDTLLRLSRKYTGQRLIAQGEQMISEATFMAQMPPRVLGRIDLSQYALAADDTDELPF
jgi:hypothetical protein